MDVDTEVFMGNIRLVAFVVPHPEVGRCRCACRKPGRFRSRSAAAHTPRRIVRHESRVRTSESMIVLLVPSVMRETGCSLINQ